MRAIFFNNRKIKKKIVVVAQIPEKKKTDKNAYFILKGLILAYQNNSRNQKMIISYFNDLNFILGN